MIGIDLNEIKDIGCPATDRELRKIRKFIKNNFDFYYWDLIARSLILGIFIKNCEVDDDTNVDEYDVNIVLDNLKELDDELTVPYDLVTTCAFVTSNGVVFSSTNQEGLLFSAKLLFGAESVDGAPTMAFIDKNVFSVNEAIKDVRNPTDEMKVGCFHFLSIRGKG